MRMQRDVVDPMGINTPFARAVETGNVDAATMIFESGAMVNTEHMIPIWMYNPLADWTDLLRALWCHLGPREDINRSSVKLFIVLIYSFRKEIKRIQLL